MVDIRVEHAYVEVVGSSSPPVRVEHAYVEVVGLGPPIRVEHAYLEILYLGRRQGIVLGALAVG